MKILKRMILVFATILLVNTPAHANLIQNGSFEDLTLPSGTSQFEWNNPGWFTTYAINLHNDSSSAYSGNQYAELITAPSGAGFRDSNIWQYIPTVPGQTYTLSFEFSPHPGLNGAYNMMEVVFGNMVDVIQMSGVGLSNIDWGFHDYTITATGSSTLVQFVNAGLPTGIDPTLGFGPGVYLDAVTVDAGAAAPEPASIAIIGLGLIGIVVFRKRYPNAN
jgi:hypothetical protein